MIAIVKGHEAVVDVLIKAGADMKSQDSDVSKYTNECVCGCVNTG